MLWTGRTRLLQWRGKVVDKVALSFRHRGE
ncbi:hypothetical protein A2U01_0038883, partial [Trifolium medium]|nr:hypothetical protein [Trifolium medium]